MTLCWVYYDVMQRIEINGKLSLVYAPRKTFLEADGANVVELDALDLQKLAQACAEVVDIRLGRVTFETPSAPGRFVQTRRIGRAGWSQVPIGGLVQDSDGNLAVRTCDAGFEILVERGKSDDDDDDAATVYESLVGDPVCVDEDSNTFGADGEGTLLAVLGTSQDAWTGDALLAALPKVGDRHTWRGLADGCLYVSRDADGRVDAVACARGRVCAWCVRDQGRQSFWTGVAALRLRLRPRGHRDH